jgi:hypothetical protein
MRVRRRRAPCRTSPPSRRCIRLAASPDRSRSAIAIWERRRGCRHTAQWCLHVHRRNRCASIPAGGYDRGGRGGGSDGGVEVTPMTISVRKNRSRAISVARKTKLAPKRDVVFDPVLNISHKIREVLLGYKSLPNYFIPIKIDRVD